MTWPMGFPVDLGFLEGKSILVTGGSGSFGTTLLHKLLTESGVGRLIVYSRDEFKQFQIQQRFPAKEYPQLRCFIGDVRDESRLSTALHGVDYVFHAAALKQVPTAEYNPFECLKTNVIGAENVVNACIANGVRHVVALSTDKAAAPINLYGASKLASDKIFVAGNHMGVPRGTSFSVVRYGNVMGSRGSVIPFFRQLADEGADHLPITSPRMTRFAITINQGVNFSLSVLKSMIDLQAAGDIHVPKLPSLRIADLASHMAPGLEQRVVGIRPGEKIHEEMVTQGDALSTVDLGDRYIIEPHFARFSRHCYRDNGAAPVPEDFRYESGSNDWWLEGEDLTELLRISLTVGV